jgi:hypothetical protein
MTEDHADKRYNADRDAQKATFQLSGDYAKWFISTLLLLNSGAIAGIFQQKGVSTKWAIFFGLASCLLSEQDFSVGLIFNGLRSIIGYLLTQKLMVNQGPNFSRQKSSVLCCGRLASPLRLGYFSQSVGY